MGVFSTFSFIGFKDQQLDSYQVKTTWLSIDHWIETQVPSLSFSFLQSG